MNTKALLRSLTRPELLASGALPAWFAWWFATFRRPGGPRRAKAPIGRCELAGLPEAAARGEPVVVTGLAKDFPVDRWGPSALRDAGGSQRALAYVLPHDFRPFTPNGQPIADLRQEGSFADLVDLVLSRKADEPRLHLADSPGWGGYGHLTTDARVPQFGYPFDPYGSWPAISSPGTRIFCHYDLWHALIVQVVGRKRILLFPPAASAQLDVASPFSSKPTSSRRAPLDEATTRDAQVVELEPGEGLFVPSMYWHEVISEDANISVLLRYMPKWHEVVRAGTFPVAWQRSLGEVFAAMRDRP